MDVFRLQVRVVDDCRRCITSFISIRDERICAEVEGALDGGLLWSEPHIGLNPSFETGDLIDKHGESGLLRSECSKIFRITEPAGTLKHPMLLHRHQLEAISATTTGANYVLTAHGEYRTKRLILERYDALAACAASGSEYQTVLDPPPADPRCAHPASTRPEWA